MKSPLQAARHFIEFFIVDNILVYQGVLGRLALKELWDTTSLSPIEIMAFGLLMMKEEFYNYIPSISRMRRTPLSSPIEMMAFGLKNTGATY